MKFYVSIKRDADNYDEKSVRMDVCEKELDDVMTTAKTILLNANENASVFIKREAE